jgi:hypothetical protein
MTEEEKELEKKYFPYLDLGNLASHDLMNYEHSYSSFIDCNECGATIHLDQTLKHAQYHKKIDDTLKELLSRPYLRRRST